MIRVFFIGGQSNAVGWGTTTLSLPTEYSATSSNIKFYDGLTNSFKDYNILVNPGINYNGTRDNSGYIHFSMEPTFVYRMREAFPNDDIYIIKYAVNSTTIAALSASTKSLFTSGKNKLDALALDYEIQGFMWYQGEADMNAQANVDTYPTYLKDIIDHCETLASNTTTFQSLIVRPSSLDCSLFLDCFPSSMPYWENWRQMIYDFTSGETYYSLIDADTLEMNPTCANRIHLQADGYLQLGMRMFNTFMNVGNNNTRTYKSLGSTGKVLNIGGTYRTIKPTTEYTDETYVTSGDVNWDGNPCG